MRGEGQRQSVQVAQSNAAAGGQGEETARTDCICESVGSALEDGRRTQTKRQLREVEDVRVAQLAKGGVKHAPCERRRRQRRGGEGADVGLRLLHFEDDGAVHLHILSRAFFLMSRR